MSQLEKYHLELLKCHRTIEAFEKIITSLKKSNPKDLPRLLDTIDIDFEKIKQSIINTLEI